MRSVKSKEHIYEKGDGTILQITDKRVMCLNVSTTKHCILAKTLWWTGCAPILFCFGSRVCFFRTFKRRQNFMNTYQQAILYNFPSKQIPIYHLPVKLQDPLVIHYKSKECMNCGTNRIHIRASEVIMH